MMFLGVSRKTCGMTTSDVRHATDSPASGAASEQRLPDNKGCSSPQNQDNCANTGLVRETVKVVLPMHLLSRNKKKILMICQVFR